MTLLPAAFFNYIVPLQIGARDVAFPRLNAFSYWVFVLVESLLLFILLRYRQRAGAATPKATHGHTALEIAWTLAPALILVFIAVPTMRTIFATQQPPAFDALKIEVIGHQWWWEYRYPSAGIVTANELHVPVGRPVVLEISTADVIHSFWAPSLGGKRDLIPGHVNRITFTAESVGTFTGQCAEFCGESHANMRLRVSVESDSAFRGWLAGQGGLGRPAAKGSVVPPLRLHRLPHGDGGLGGSDRAELDARGQSHDDRRRRAAEHARGPGALDQRSAGREARR
ncbi:MAG: cytochrome c oxidase subunit II [Gemmatimonadetes bacterium 13_1_40CM_4_69_5]|nr:MAG: cytochrome c oxidase subunit II [Gemmatimonadetes bacterium 13_1_40CM_4_69_5]